MHTIQMSNPVGASLLWCVFEYDRDLPGTRPHAILSHTRKAQDNHYDQGHAPHDKSK